MTKATTLESSVKCDRAEDLLDELSPHRGGHLWGTLARQEGWIFRGQAEAVWRLTPSAQRTKETKAGKVYDAFRPYIPGQVEMYATTARKRLDMEESVALDFVGRVDLNGLGVPGDTQRLRDPEYAVAAHDGKDFPPIDQRGMYALAQHYGIPTRLLDWTSKPLVAAYFAAVEAASHLKRGAPPEESSDGRLAVWAVQRPLIEQVCSKWNPGATVVTVPTTSNPNLHAQGGIFTLVRYRTPPAPDQDIPTLDDLLREPPLSGDPLRTQVFSLAEPMLYKFTLPHAQAPRLLHFLHLHGVDASSVFPGHKAVSECMKEGSIRSVTRPGGE